MSAELKALGSQRVELRGGESRLMPVGGEASAVLVKYAQVAPTHVINQDEEDIGLWGGAGLGRIRASAQYAKEERDERNLGTAVELMEGGTTLVSHDLSSIAPRTSIDNSVVAISSRPGAQRRWETTIERWR